MTDIYEITEHDPLIEDCKRESIRLATESDPEPENPELFAKMAEAVKTMLQMAHEINRDVCSQNGLLEYERKCLELNPTMLQYLYPNLKELNLLFPDMNLDFILKSVLAHQLICKPALTQDEKYYARAHISKNSYFLTAFFLFNCGLNDSHIMFSDQIQTQNKENPTLHEYRVSIANITDPEIGGLNLNGFPVTAELGIINALNYIRSIHKVKRSDEEKWLLNKNNYCTSLLWCYLYELHKQTTWVYGEDPEMHQVFSASMYHPSFENTRINVSPRALEMLLNGELDVKMPEDMDIQKVIEEKRNGAQIALPKNISHEETATWGTTAKLHLINSAAIANERYKTAILQTLSHPMPTVITVVPVKYGTVGSFANIFATLINSFRKIKSHEQALNTNLDNFQGIMLEQYQVSALTINLEDSFSVLIRLPEDPNDLSEDEISNLIIEEAIHLALYPFTAYFEGTHAQEEKFIEEYLKRVGIKHCGTNPNGADNQLLINKINECLDSYLPSGNLFGAYVSLLKMNQATPKK